MDADWGSSSDEEESALRKEKEEAKRKETMVNRAPTLFWRCVLACSVTVPGTQALMKHARASVRPLLQT
jgi:hypothetical protein